jgi:hypothetical protein
VVTVPKGTANKTTSGKALGRAMREQSRYSKSGMTETTIPMVSAAVSKS